MSFSHAQIDPFNSEAYGAQVPDEYSFPTCTTCVKQSSTISSDGLGNMDLAFMPHPLACLFTGNGDLGGALAALWASSAQFAAGTRCRHAGLLAVGDIATWRKYRVLGFGVRLRSLLVPLNATGVLQYVTLPTADRLMNQATQGALSNSERADLYDWYQLPITDGNGYFGTTLENYTTASRMEHYAFNQHGLEWSAHACGPDAFAWKNGQNGMQLSTATQTYNAGSAQMYNVTTPASSTNDDFPYMMLKDWTMLCVRGTQLPANVPVCDIEIIMHIEYIDKNTATLGGNGKYPPVVPAALGQVAAAAAHMPFYRSLPSDVSAKMQSRLGF